MYRTYNENYIVKTEKLGKAEMYIVISYSEFYKDGGIHPDSSSRDSTEEEIAWLEACIKADKFIPKESVETVVNSYQIY